MSESMKLLILGGSGFVSGTLARLALARGHQVWAVTRGQRSLPECVTGLAADRHAGDEFRAAIQGAGVHWDLVVDCIAFEAADIEQDVAVLTPLAGHLVMISSDFVYDASRRRFPQTEEGETTALGYGAKKHQAELALQAAHTGRMAWTVLRPCHIYGPGSLLGCLPTHGRDARLLERLRAGEALRLGLVNRVSKPGQALEKAVSLAEMIAANGPRAVAHALEVIRQSMNLPFHKALDLETEKAVSLIMSGECIYGVAAFLEKKEPEFPDIV